MTTVTGLEYGISVVVLGAGDVAGVFCRGGMTSGRSPDPREGSSRESGSPEPSSGRTSARLKTIRSVLSGVVGVLRDEVVVVVVVVDVDLGVGLIVVVVDVVVVDLVDAVVRRGYSPMLEGAFGGCVARRGAVTAVVGS